MAGESDGPDSSKAEGLGVEDRWREWNSGTEAAAPSVREVQQGGESSEFRPPGRRSALLTLGLLALAALGVWAGVGFGGREGSQTALPGTALSTTEASGQKRQRTVDLTRLATADASSAPVVELPQGGVARFSADNVTDRSPVSAWRTNGPGDGQTLTLTFTRTVTVTRVGLAVGQPEFENAGSIPSAIRGRLVEQVSWSAEGRNEVQQLDPSSHGIQYVALAEPVTTRSLTLRLDRTAPGPVATDDFAAVTQVVVLGVR